jgi:methylmalonyl-CoA/ethylmalonyl-CoA epimerase
MREARLHHIGIVVRSIEESMGGYVSSMEASWDSQIHHDPIQKVRVAFLRPGTPEEAQIELVEPAGADSPVTRFLEQGGGGLHHLCYEVADLNAHLTRMRARGCRLAKPPAAAVAFGGRRIAWMLTPQNLLLEFLEQAK